MEQKSVYGYVRVSSVDQNEDRQMAALEKAGVSIGNIFWISSRERIFTARHTKKWYYS